MNNIIRFPVKEAQKAEQEKLFEEVAYLVSVFQEIEECGRKTGNPNLLSKVYVALTSVVMTARKAAADGKAQ